MIGVITQTRISGLQYIALFIRAMKSLATGFPETTSLTDYELVPRAMSTTALPPAKKIENKNRKTPNCAYHMRRNKN